MSLCYLNGPLVFIYSQCYTLWVTPTFLSLSCMVSWTWIIRCLCQTWFHFMQNWWNIKFCISFCVRSFNIYMSDGLFILFNSYEMDVSVCELKVGFCPYMTICQIFSFVLCYVVLNNFIFWICCWRERRKILLILLLLFISFVFEFRI